MSAPESGRASVLHEPLTERIQTSIVGAGSEVVTCLIVDSCDGWVLFVCGDLVAGTGGGRDPGVGDA